MKDLQPVLFGVLKQVVYLVSYSLSIYILGHVFME